MRLRSLICSDFPLYRPKPGTNPIAWRNPRKGGSRTTEAGEFAVPRFTINMMGHAPLMPGEGSGAAMLSAVVPRMRMPLKPNDRWLHFLAKSASLPGGGPVLGRHVRRDSPAVLDLKAIFPCPAAYFAAVYPTHGRFFRVAGRGCPPACRRITRQCVSQFPRVSRTKVYFVVHAVETETNRSLGRTAVQVVDEYSACPLSHSISARINIEICWRPGQPCRRNRCGQ